uniref:Uncharacterized protein n=1 Tax=Manihot esculenta TaxID=3983 RepID=A0A2C9WGV8_MANES
MNKVLDPRRVGLVKDWIFYGSAPVLKQLQLCFFYYVRFWF